MAIKRKSAGQRQRALADFGDFTLCCDDLQTTLDEGCRLVANALGVPLAKIMEIEAGHNTALVRAGVGWRSGIVGIKRISLDDGSAEAFAIKISEPVVIMDVDSESRFHIPEFLFEHGIVALVNVPIFLPGGVPYGILEVDSHKARNFSDNDVQFLRTYASILGPVIDRLFKIADLVSSNERFRVVVENARDVAILISDPIGMITDWFPGAEDTFGWSEKEMVGQNVSILFTEQDNETGAPEWEAETAVTNGKAPDVRWHVTKGGKLVYLDGQTIALRNTNGTLRGFLKIAHNLTARKKLEERQAVLLAELQHRVRNVLAIVAAIVQRCNIDVSTRELRDLISGRVAAMARTQALLTQDAGAGVQLEHMVREELLSQTEENRFTIDGSPVLLSPKAAEVLTLSVHELTTNACKYGALAAPTGRVDVHWITDSREGQEWLEFFWSETGVDLRPVIPRRTGFGTELITRRVPYELGGQGQLNFSEQGLQCSIIFPLIRGDSILQPGSASETLHDGRR
ncbi:MAG: PAS domain S-box protein [Sphingomonas sp.]|nr:MAG: PAS domain S-box protein [Sphingomonas sp.]